MTRTHKSYLGDGVYVAFDGFNVVLTAENGVSVLNVVYLEPATIIAFEMWLTELRAGLRAQLPPQDTPQG